MQLCDECGSDILVRNEENFIVCTECGLVQNDIVFEMQNEYIKKGNFVIKEKLQRILSFFEGLPWLDECCNMIPKNCVSFVTAAASVCSVAKRHGVIISPTDMEKATEIKAKSIVRECEKRGWMFFNWMEIFESELALLCEKYGRNIKDFEGRRPLRESGNPRKAALAFMLKKYRDLWKSAGTKLKNSLHNYWENCSDI